MATSFTRRQILAAGLGAISVAVAPRRGATATATPGSFLLISAADINREHHVVATDKYGRLAFQVRLPFRGHEALVTPDKQWLIVMPRRPGKIGAKIRLSDPENYSLFCAGYGRHFYGHAVLTRDGEFLISSENDFEAGRGVLSVRKTQDLSVISEIGSGGIGPHQIAWLSDQKTLAVANGGILTHPDKPRKKLNLDSMRPNLTLVSLDDGLIQQQFESPNYQSSMRHIDVTPDDDVVVGLQHEGDYSESVPLVVVARVNGAIEVLPQPIADTLNMKQYIASVAVDPKTFIVAVTSPRGHQIAFWDVRTSKYLGQKRLRDVAGLAIEKGTNGFFASTGVGRIDRFSAIAPLHSSGISLKTPGVQWDNHLLLVEGVNAA